MVRAAVFAVLLGLAAGDASAERRVALVIGNSNYLSTAPLANPSNDAGDVAAKLESLGFEVISRTDLDMSGMNTAFRDFARAVRGAETALFYYAGHAMQFEGINYLMPVDASLRDEADLPYEMANLDDVVSDMSRASGVRMVILDACRDNPLEEKLKQGLASSRSVAGTRGLARMPKTQGLLVAFATQAGAVAADGDGRNSPFASAFLQHVATPALEVGTLFRRVAAEVNRTTSGRQTPELSISLLGEFYFQASVADSPAVLSPPVSGGGDSGSRSGPDAAAGWDAIKTMDSPAVFEAFIRRFEGTIYADFAKARLDELRRASGGLVTALGSLNSGVSAGPPGSRFRDCDVCPELVVVPRGTFMMGSADGEEGRDEDEGPRHEVRFERDFAVGRFEVKVDQFAAFVTETGHELPGVCQGWDEEKSDWFDLETANFQEPGFAQTGEHPVTCVTWRDAKAYAGWLSNRTGKSYRLLSESEWEYVARAGTRTAFYTGPMISTSLANFDGDYTYAGSAVGEDRGATLPVGSFTANSFGLHDIHGNVSEWVEDCWKDNYADAPTDGSPQRTGNCDMRAVRGGSWENEPKRSRSSYRNLYGVGVRINFGGFRIARDLDR